MKILGQGHKGIVVTDTVGAARKFYLSEAEALKEQAQLEFVASMQEQGFDIGCTVPKLLEVVGKGKWEIDGKTYVYCNRLERIPGINAMQAMPDFADHETAILGKDLGAVIFTMHAASKPHVERWKRAFWSHDDLLRHLLEEKAAQVIREEPNRSVVERVKEAARYLEDRRESLAAENTLSHCDLNLPNVLVNTSGHVNGLVDWGGFGLTNPSLCLYQLAARPAVWPHVKRQYEHMGGAIQEDIVYAGAVIHLAWAPIICAELGLPLDDDSTREHFEAMYKKFKRHAAERYP